MSVEDAVRATRTYQSFATHHPDVEVWPDTGFSEGGYSYCWIVSNRQGTVRNLAYVRLAPGVFQVRGYDANGDDVWADAE